MTTHRVVMRSTRLRGRPGRTAPCRGSVISTTSLSARPTSRTDIRVHWHTPEPPTAVMAAGDVWIPS